MPAGSFKVGPEVYADVSSNIDLLINLIVLVARAAVLVAHHYRLDAIEGNGGDG